MKKYTGFTLAEVLITLAIIGVVAAMTVPALMTNTRGKEFEVGANKAMSNLANAITMRYAMDGVEFPDFAAQWAAVGNAGDTAMRGYLTFPPGTEFLGGGGRANIVDANGNVIGVAQQLGNMAQANVREGEQPALPISQEIDESSVKTKDGMIVWFDTFGGMTVLTVDTNGDKGPTRGETANFNFANRQNIDGCVVSVAQANCVPTTNLHPDIVSFRVVPDAQGRLTSAIAPINQRTRNIMTTGNAMIAR